MATAYLLRDREPRLLCLNAFALHKSKGRKTSKKPESEKAKAKREAEELAI